MPRKNKTPAVMARLRDNQRQSRERHRQFVEGLQQRLREHERQGARATLDMQRAARAVALENRLLRDLLARRGVPHDEVARFVRSRLGAAVPGGGTAEGALVSPGSRASPAAPPQQQQLSGPAVDMGGTRRSPSLGPKSAHSRVVACSGVAAPDVVGAAAEHISHQELDPHYGGRASVDGSTRPGSPLPAGAPCLRSAAVPAKSSMETLCETAAAIVAEVQGHNDTGRAFAALGCEGAAGCTVGNLKIFDIIDSS